MSFETFTIQFQVIFNICDKEGKKILEDTRIRFLFKKVEYLDLKVTIAALKSHMINTNVLCIEAAKHIATAVSELPEYISKNRNISVVITGGDKLNSSSSAIHKPDGTIITDHIPT